MESARNTLIPGRLSRRHIALPTILYLPLLMRTYGSLFPAVDNAQMCSSERRPFSSNLSPKIPDRARYESLMNQF